jgi:hypothetical protein
MSANEQTISSRACLIYQADVTDAWVTVLAAAKGNSGTVSRMELWVNGGKIANFPGDRINTNLFLQDLSTVTI